MSDEKIKKYTHLRIELVDDPSDSFEFDNVGIDFDQPLDGLFTVYDNESKQKVGIFPTSRLHSAVWTLED